MILLIISVLCFWITWKFTRGFEIQNYSGDWKPFKIPLWGWGVVCIVCLIPVLNVMVLITCGVIIIAESRGPYPDVRFTGANSVNNFITKIVNLLNREY